MFNFSDEIRYKNLEIKINAVESRDREKLFSPKHTKFDATLDINGKTFDFNYQCNMAFLEPTANDMLYSVINDAMCYEDSTSLGDFIKQFGSTETASDIDDMVVSYELCKKARDFLEDAVGMDVAYEIMEAIDNDEMCEEER